MIRSVVNLPRISTMNLFYSRVFSSTPLNDLSNNSHGNRKNDYDEKKSRKINPKYSRNIFLFASIWISIKDYLGIEKVSVNSDYIRKLVKKAWFCVQDKKFDDALQILEQALKMALDSKDENSLTKIYSEIGDVYFKMNNNEKAEEYYKLILQRYIETHRYNDSHPAFIISSIKLATVFANKGDLDSAEMGMKHCIRKQMSNVDEHLKKYIVAHGAYYQENNIVDARSFEYTDPLALFGFILNTYAHFLVNNRGEDRLAEAVECMDESLKFAYTIYGTTSAHLINILNTFSVDCMAKKYYTTAKKYLNIGINRVINIQDDNDLIVRYYCNYAEALFYTGEIQKAQEYAGKAVNFSKNSNEDVQKLARNCFYFVKSGRSFEKNGEKTKWFYFF